MLPPLKDKKIICICTHLLQTKYTKCMVIWGPWEAISQSILTKCIFSEHFLWSPEYTLVVYTNKHCFYHLSVAWRYKILYCYTIKAHSVRCMQFLFIRGKHNQCQHNNQCSKTDRWVFHVCSINIAVATPIISGANIMKGNSDTIKKNISHRTFWKLALKVYFSPWHDT